MDYITPVLYITFYRHEYARQSFDAIKMAKPKKLYFYSNAPRLDRLEEIEGNKLIRSFVGEIDWECELHTFFRENYVDMVESHEGAYGWVFKTEKQLIEIDEDCIASIAFFDYCEKMLNHYSDEKRIWLVSGDNFTPQYNESNDNIIFSRYGHTYGFGLWKDRWEKFPRKINDWNISDNILMFNKYYGNKKAAKFHLKRINHYFVKIYPNHPIWDLLMCYEMIKTNGLAIIPKYNLVRNIGEIGDHSRKRKKSYFNTLDLYEKETYPIDNYPLEVVSDDFYDLNHYKNHWLKSREKLPRRILNKLVKVIKTIFSKIQ